MVAFKYSSRLIGICLAVVMDSGWCTCTNRIYVPPSGEIYSPKYPNPYDNNTNCMWHIISRDRSGTIVLSVEDLDIEPDAGHSCRHNWLSLPVSGAGRVKTQQLCGRRPPTKPIRVHAPEVAIKMHTSHIEQGGRGFRLAYRLALPASCTTAGMVPCGPRADAGCYNNLTQRCDGRQDCDSGLDEADCASARCQLDCANGKGCYSFAQKCDKTPDCEDFSDEVDCGECAKPGQAMCEAPGRKVCFQPSTQRCDGRLDCPHGEDEAGCVPGCEGKIACSSGEGCYLPAQRCDSLSDCLDLSDESFCHQDICLIADPTTNSMVALAVMGCLFCGLLLVLAVGCAFRVYGQRYAPSPSTSNYRLHISPHLASRLRYRMATTVSLPSLIDDEYFHREPPPAYSVAVGQCEPRRTRRHRPLPVPPPQVVAKPPDTAVVEASSSQSSPSRGSVTSSSYVSGTDDTVLLSS